MHKVQVNKISASKKKDTRNDKKIDGTFLFI